MSMTIQPPAGTKWSVFFRQSRAELRAGLKLAAQIRREIESRKGAERLGLRSRFFPRLDAARKTLVFHRSLIFADPFVFRFGCHLALPKCARAIEDLEAVARELGIATEGERDCA